MEFSSANTTSGATGSIFGPGLGETQLAVLTALKRLGATTQARIALDLPLAPATLREHLRSLTLRGLVERRGAQRGKPGRPEVVYGLTDRAERLFPRHESQLLQELATYLIAEGHGQVLDHFLAQRVAQRRPAALARVRGLTGLARFHAVARLLSENGFLALVAGSADRPSLRLCHCPIRDLVSVTQAPCRYEQALVAELLDRPLDREEYLLDGQAACSYRPTGPTSLNEESV